MYPVNPDQQFVHGPSGMSLRDWFAGMALQGIMANTTVEGLQEFKGVKVAQMLFAEVSYILADAMITKREKDNQ